MISLIDFNKPLEAIPVNKESTHPSKKQISQGIDQQLSVVTDHIIKHAQPYLPTDGFSKLKDIVKTSLKDSTSKIIKQIAKEKGVSPRDVTSTHVMLYGAEAEREKKIPTFLSLAEADIDRRVENSFSSYLKKLGDKESILIGQNTLRLISNELKTVVDSHVLKIKKFQTQYTKLESKFDQFFRLANNSNRDVIAEKAYAKIWNSYQTHLDKVDQLVIDFNSFTRDEKNYLISQGITEQSIRDLPEPKTYEVPKEKITESSMKKRVKNLTSHEDRSKIEEINPSPPSLEISSQTENTPLLGSPSSQSVRTSSKSSSPTESETVSKKNPKDFVPSQFSTIQKIFTLGGAILFWKQVNKFVRVNDPTLEETKLTKTCKKIIACAHPLLSRLHYAFTTPFEMTKNFFKGFADAWKVVVLTRKVDLLSPDLVKGSGGIAGTAKKVGYVALKYIFIIGPKTFFHITQATVGNFMIATPLKGAVFFIFGARKVGMGKKLPKFFSKSFTDYIKEASQSIQKAFHRMKRVRIVKEIENHSPTQLADNQAAKSASKSETGEVTGIKDRMIAGYNWFFAPRLNGYSRFQIIVKNIQNLGTNLSNKIDYAFTANRTITAMEQTILNKSTDHRRSTKKSNASSLMTPKSKNQRKTSISKKRALSSGIDKDIGSMPPLEI